jgi:small redox-active disulfide protein 2
LKKEKNMEIKVLGPGCMKCRKTEDLVKETVVESGVEAHIDKVTDIMKIADYGVMGTPAVIVNGEVVSVGKVPTKEEIKKWITK